ncbi:DUF6163 family protein [Nitratireductor luteus]|uniref:DUF6163 family protein n=1 Tax=Nitratireductor luteus TaxID=2976980 RepID=UPI00223F21C5|nr:DUF6163 family protein [Nitratireductor luteus]
MTKEEAAGLTVRPSSLDFASELFLRAVAISCLVLGIAYWVRLLGFFDGPQWRFDLMPVYWQATAVPLAVLFPFAAVGLWALASWGPVVWFLCASMEAVMYAGFPHLYGARPWLLILHGLVAVLYIALRAAFALRSRKAH